MFSKILISLKIKKIEKIFWIAFFYINVPERSFLNVPERSWKFLNVPERPTLLSVCKRFMTVAELFLSLKKHKQSKTLMRTVKIVRAGLSNALEQIAETVHGSMTHILTVSRIAYCSTMLH
jgi:hypothetical protein